jgi:septum formation protein
MASMDEMLVLASASPVRAALLRNAGLIFEVDPAAVDEARLKGRCREVGCNALECAAALAEAKARAVSPRHPRALVIGADQILVVDDEWLDKPTDLNEASRQLERLRGREHGLATAACVVCDGETVWRGASLPRLTMRAFSNDFLAAYAAAEGDALLGSVGAYRLEGLGAQLIAQIEGDYFAILGLPLLDILAFLRARGAIAA